VNCETLAKKNDISVVGEGFVILLNVYNIFQFS